MYLLTADNKIGIMEPCSLTQAANFIRGIAKQYPLRLLDLNSYFHTLDSREEQFTFSNNQDAPIGSITTN